METKRRKSSLMLSPYELNPSLAVENLDRKRNPDMKELPDWSALTGSVLFYIAQLLDTMDDYSAFRHECQMWRYAAAPAKDVLASQHPLIVVELNYGSPGLYDIISHRLHRLEQGSWILTYAQGFIVTRNHKLLMTGIKLTNIFTKTQIRVPWPDNQSIFHENPRVIFSKCPSVHDCLIVFYIPGESIFGSYRIEDTRCVIYDKNKSNYKGFDDMIFFMGRLYALSQGDLLLVELAPNLKITNLGGNNTLIKDKMLKWKLGELGGEILLICCDRMIMYFKANGFCTYEDGINIYVWNFKERKWEKRSSLAGKTLFIGYEFGEGLYFGRSIAPTSATFKIKGDCVYLMDKPFSKDWLLYSLEDKSVESCLIAERFSKPDNKLLMQHIWVLPSFC